MDRNIQLPQDTLTLSGTGTDTDGVIDSVQWIQLSGPSASILSGDTTLNVLLSALQQGVYTYQLKVTDDDGDSDRDTVAVTVIPDVPLNVDPIYVNFNRSWVNNIPAPWFNNFSTTPVQGLVLSDLIDETGFNTGIDVTLVTNWFRDHGNGMAVDGFTPERVMRTAYWFKTDQESFKLSSLNPLLRYDLTFFASYNNATSRLTEYTVGAQTVSLEPAFNTSNAVTIFGLIPDGSGEILIDVKKGPGSLGGYINALVIQPSIDDANPPAAPTNLLATAISESQIDLSWTDNSNNENGFEIERSLTMGGLYAVIDSISPSVTSYSDVGLSSQTTYYYRVRAHNNNGDSVSNEASATTLVPPPPPTDPSNPAAVAVSHGQIDLSWVDNSNNETGFEIHRSTMSSGPYALIDTTGTDEESYSDANGIMQETTYYYVIRAVNLTGPSNFTAEVSATTPAAPLNVDPIYVNFNRSWVNNIPAPWFNNFSTTPVQGLVLSDLIDETGFNTGIDVTLVTNWFRDHGNGMAVDGFTPERVMRTAYWFKTDQESFKLSSLNPSLRYDLTFFASYNNATSRLTEYTVGAQTVSLEPAFNTSNAVTIFGLIPDGSGEIMIEVKKGPGSIGGYINAMIILPSTDPSARLADIEGAIEEDLQPSAVSIQSIYPNPFRKNIIIGFSADYSGELSIIMMDAFGKIVFDKDYNLERSSSLELGVNGANMKSGLYLLKVYSAENVINRTFRILKE